MQHGFSISIHRPVAVENRRLSVLSLDGKDGNHISIFGIISKSATNFIGHKRTLPRPCKSSVGKPTIFMSNTAPIGLGLCTIFTWGGSNFLGGYASRRASPFTLSAISHLSALAFMILVASALHVPLPSRQALLWALCAGLAGGLALAVLYGSLSSGRMGLAAPVVAVLSSGIPAVVTTFREGSPSAPRLIGFALAILGVSLISQKEDKTDLKALRLAVLAGCGFAAYSLAIKQTGSGSAMWIEVHSRVAAFLVTAAITLGAGKITPLDRRAGFWAATAGLLDTIGSVAFVRASQLGRLDIVVVLSSLYPAVTVLLAMAFLRERLTRWKTLGVSAAIVALPLIAGPSSR